MANHFPTRADCEWSIRILQDRLARIQKRLGEIGHDQQGLPEHYAEYRELAVEYDDLMGYARTTEAELTVVRAKAVTDEAFEKRLNAVIKEADSAHKYSQERWHGQRAFRDARLHRRQHLNILEAKLKEMGRPVLIRS